MKLPLPAFVDAKSPLSLKGMSLFCALTNNVALVHGRPAYAVDVISDEVNFKFFFIPSDLFTLTFHSTHLYLFYVDFLHKYMISASLTDKNIKVLLLQHRLFVDRSLQTFYTKSNCFLDERILFFFMRHTLKVDNVLSRVHSGKPFSRRHRSNRSAQLA